MNQATSNTSAVELLKLLPSVHKLLSSGELEAAAENNGRSLVLEATRACLEVWRHRLQSGIAVAPPDSELLIREILEVLELRKESSIRRVLNATGILLHTGLGRAPLPDQAVGALLQASGYCNVELDLVTGERTRRHEVVEDDLCALTGAEAALVVNNNAGATGLVLATFAAGRELIVSHGQLIEIGGGFRLPDVFRAYGATLRAVGTTNRTRPQDYEAAINERTGAIMLVHTSNYQVVGFTQQADLRELVELARDRDFPVVHDIGSGALVNQFTTSDHPEPLASESVKQGADLVLFSGDKLLGGPQVGIIVGKRHCVEQLARHPMSRALRVDKLTLAALQATLSIYRRGLSDPAAYDEIPFLRMVRTPVEELEQRANDLVVKLSNRTGQWQLETMASDAYVGGGSLPGNKIESWALVIRPTNDQASVEVLAKRLRTAHPAVVGRLHQGRLLIDLRGIAPKDDEALAEVVGDFLRLA